MLGNSLVRPCSRILGRLFLVELLPILGGKHEFIPDPFLCVFVIRGKTTDPDFQQELMADFHKVVQVPIPSWPCKYPPLHALQLLVQQANYKTAYVIDPSTCLWNRFSGYSVGMEAHSTLHS
jgi:hypothetical protein